MVRCLSQCDQNQSGKLSRRFVDLEPGGSDLKKTVLTLILVLASVVFAACGDNKTADSPADAPAPDAEADVAAIYNQYVEAVKARDGETACGLLTEEYQEQVLQEAQAFEELEGANCPKATTAFSALLSGFKPSLEEVRVRGNKASGTDPGGKGYEPQTLKFERIDGDWKIAGQTDSGAADAEGGLPDQTIVKSWPVKWCEAEIGMTRDDLRKIMGEPTEEYTPESTPNGFQPQMVWDAFEYHFTAFFDVDDRVRQMDANDLDLTAGQKRAIRCGFSRRA